MVRKRGKHTWEIRIYLGRGSDGKPDYHYETFYAPLKSLAQDRERELTKIHRAQKTGSRQLLMNIEQLMNAWLTTLKEQGTASQRTRETYEWHFNKLNPVVGSLSLYGLTAFEVQNALSGQFDGLATATKKGLYGTLRTALKQGFKWGVLNSDISSGIVTPQGAETPEKTVLNLNQLTVLLEAVKPYKHHLVLRILIVTGARLGEVLGLKRGDIDFEKGSIRIIRAADTRNRKINSKPKTKASRRTILLDEDTLWLIRVHLDRMESRPVVPIGLLASEQLLFSAEDGRPIRHRAIALTLQRALKKAGLPPLGIHNLRHSVASILADSDQSITSITNLLGHINSKSTEPYLHRMRAGTNILDTMAKGGKMGGKG